MTTMALLPQQLKSALWEAANTLRGSAVDRTDCKGYILPLLFVKRICDVWDEETAGAAEIFDDEDPAPFPKFIDSWFLKGAFGVRPIGIA